MFASGTMDVHVRSLNTGRRVGAAFDRVTDDGGERIYRKSLSRLRLARLWNRSRAPAASGWGAALVA